MTDGALLKLDSDDFAKLLMAEDRREWQNPEIILEQIGIAEGSSAADLACGPGFFTIPLAIKIGNLGQIYAVDNNPVMLRYLKANLESSNLEENLAKIRIIEADVSSTDIPDEGVDLVIFANILHDLKDKKSYFKEMRRIAKRTARFVDIDWHKRETANMGPPLERRLSENESRAIIRENGLVIVHALNAGPHHYGFVCQQG
jgi:ubiquinone/menaquinone biosynthesis C-methylase UbiE